LECFRKGEKRKIIFDAFSAGHHHSCCLDDDDDFLHFYFE
jgi:hypothetical protein